jgi:hypothetical protein
MGLTRTKIEKRDIAPIALGALAGLLLPAIAIVWAGGDMTTALLVGLLMGAPSGAGGGVLACLLSRHLHLEPNRKISSTVRRLGATNLLIIGVVLLLAWLALAFVFSLTLKQSFTASFRTSFAAILVFIPLHFLVSWLYGRCGRGRILLDCGPFPNGRQLFLSGFALYASLFAFVGLGAVFSGATAPDLLSIAWLAFLSWSSVSCLIMASARLQLRERGIWQYCNLIRWSRIGSYRWADDSTLLVKYSGRLWFLRRVVLVAPEHRQAVDDLLTQHCGVRHVA